MHVAHRIAFLIALSAIVTTSRAAEAPQEMLLWPEDHPANQGEELSTVDSPEWTERVTKSPTLTPFFPDEGNRNGAAIVICPGGGYKGLAMAKEGLEVAEWLRSKGIVGVVLRYRCGGGRNEQPVPLEDARRAIRTVRANADQWGVDPERVGILGFSAGGHLASCAATMFEDGEPDAEDPIERVSSRPDFAALVYPVIVMQLGNVGHAGSRRNLLGDDVSNKLGHYWSTETQVTKRTPPTFLVHAHDDKSVHVLNSLMFYDALLKHEVPAELHIYEVGGHGFGMFRGERPVDKWPEQLERWLKQRAIIGSGAN